MRESANRNPRDREGDKAARFDSSSSSATSHWSCDSERSTKKQSRESLRKRRYPSRWDVAHPRSDIPAVRAALKLFEMLDRDEARAAINGESKRSRGSDQVRYFRLSKDEVAMLAERSNAIGFSRVKKPRAASRRRIGTRTNSKTSSHTSEVSCESTRGWREREGSLAANLQPSGEAGRCRTGRGALAEDDTLVATDGQAAIQRRRVSNRVRRSAASRFRTKIKAGARYRSGGDRLVRVDRRSLLDVDLNSASRRESSSARRRDDAIARSASIRRRGPRLFDCGRGAAGVDARSARA